MNIVEFKKLVNELEKRGIEYLVEGGDVVKLYVVVDESVDDEVLRLFDEINVFSPDRIVADAKVRDEYGFVEVENDNKCRVLVSVYEELPIKNVVCIVSKNPSDLLKVAKRMKYRGVKDIIRFGEYWRMQFQVLGFSKGVKIYLDKNDIEDVVEYLNKILY